MINSSRNGQEASFFDFNNLSGWAISVGPRVIIVGVVAYTSLGVCYVFGVMATIDRIAIPILREHYGFFGVGAIMPTFQWYSALAVRTLSSLAALGLYELISRIIKRCWNGVFPQKASASEGAVPLVDLAAAVKV